MSEKSRPPRYVRRLFRVAPPAYSARDDGLDRAEGSRRAATAVSTEERQEAGGIEATNPALNGRALLDEEGRIDLFLNLKETPPPFSEEEGLSLQDSRPSPSSSEGLKIPILNIVIFIVGSRGDVQPYLALALRLITSHSHRVRIATHGNFKDFVLDANRFLKGKTGRGGMSLEGRLEFADVGGDPKALMSYMVKNPGLLPSLPSLFQGEVSKKRKMTGEMMIGFYQACFFPDPLNGDFAADAIISNPPAFAHISIAEALGLPLLLTFTMPWTATRSYQHPLVNVRESNAGTAITNYMSYTLADILIFQGLGDVVNTFRKTVLGLEPISSKLGPSLIDRLRMPWTYCWSESLLSRPKDWKRHIDLSGFYFLDNDTTFEPPAELVAFLENGSAPIYIGFGSVVIEDPEKTSALIFEAIKQASVRAIVHSGWAGLGKGMEEDEDDILVYDKDVPHDWLFAGGKVAAVCHHGGAGTTAIGLREGLPTIIIPFFGDQPFWGLAVSRAGAGPPPIPFKELSAERLASAFTFAISPEAKRAAGEIGTRISNEDAMQKGVDSFHRHLPLDRMLCDIDPTRVAVWWSEELCLRLSAGVAGVLAEEGLIDMKKLKPHRTKIWDMTRHNLEPLSGVLKGTMHVSSVLFSGFAELFYRPIKGLAKITYGTLEASFAVSADMLQGFDNVPGLIGSPVREVGRVTNFTSGVREGVKAFAFGAWDGVTGLVTEPIHGGIQEGAIGVVKGVGRSYVNAVIRPLTGSLAFLIQPWRGSYFTIRNSTRTRFSALSVLRGPRESTSFKEAALFTPEERADILSEWPAIKKVVRKRRRKLNHMRNRVFLIDKKGKAVAVGKIDTSTASATSPDSVNTPVATPSTPSLISPSGQSRQSTRRSSIPTPVRALYNTELSSIEESLKASYIADATTSTTVSPHEGEEPSPTTLISPTTAMLVEAIKGSSPLSSRYDEDVAMYSTMNGLESAMAGPSSLLLAIPPAAGSAEEFQPEGEGWRGGPIDKSSAS